MTTEEKVSSIARTLQQLMGSEFESGRNLIHFIVLNNEDKPMGWLQRACRNALVDEKREGSEFPIPRGERQPANGVVNSYTTPDVRGSGELRGGSMFGEGVAGETTAIAAKSVEVWAANEQAARLREAMEELTAEERAVVDVVYFASKPVRHFAYQQEYAREKKVPLKQEQGRGLRLAAKQLKLPMAKIKALHTAALVKLKGELS